MDVSKRDMNDVFDLQRFIKAQEPAYGLVVAELKGGQKRGHWMWYIFPQMQGLGGSAMSQKYAISCRNEAKAYSEHPILGSRLRECTDLVLSANVHTVEQIFDYPDNLKFRSCMTLFGESAVEPNIFRAALLKYFGGNPDQLTLDILARLA
jgi:uncharacterized protein (DUF1810 family)